MNIDEALEQAAKEIQAENLKENVAKFKRKLRELENARKIVANIELELEVMKRDMGA